MKVALTILTLVVTTELVLSVPGYGPPQPLPAPNKYNRPHPNGGGHIPAKFQSPHFGGNFGKNDFYSKYNPHSLPPGIRGSLLPQLPSHFGKFPPPPPGKQQHQQQQYQQQQHQQQQYQQHQHQQHQHKQQHQQQQHQHQQQQQQQPYHPPNFKPLGPQFQSKPYSNPNGAPPQGQAGGSGQDRILQQGQQRPTPKITNVFGTAPKLPLSGPPDFQPHYPPAPVAPVQIPASFQEKPRGPYIINSDDERGPIKTIPAPNLNPADKPANFEEQLYKAQHQHTYVQPLDNSIVEDKPSYQVTEDPSRYKPFSGQPSYFAPDPDTVSTPKVPPTTDANSIPTVGKVPLDIALQQHLDKQHQQQLSAEHGTSDTLTPQELYSLLNGNPTAVVGPQTAYMVPQQVVYAVPQPQPLDMQVGHQVQYQPQAVQLQYAQQPAATAVQLQYAQPTAAAADLQYLQPQTVQYQPQTVQYQPQTVQYQPQAVQYQQYQQQSAEQYSAQPTAEGPAYEQQQQQEQEQDEIIYKQQQQQHQKQQQQQQQQQQDQLHEQHDRDQQQLKENNNVRYQQEQVDDYQPRNRENNVVEQQEPDEQQDQKKFESIRDQYYSAVPNEQTAGVLAQIAESAANSDASAAVAVAADEPSHVDTVKSADEAPSAADQTVKLKTSVQIQQSVPLYEGTYASSRRTNQEYVDEGGEDELMEGSESAMVSAVSGSSASSSSSVNGHAPSQFPYNAAKINAFATN